MFLEEPSGRLAEQDLYPDNSPMQSLRSAALSGLRERLAKGPLLPAGETDNFAQKREENEQAVAQLLEEVDFHYGFDLILQDQNTKVFVMEDGSVLLVADQQLFYTEENGRIKAQGVCQNESWVLSQLINATTQWDIPLAKARIYEDMSDHHVRVTNVNPNLYPGDFPAEKVDSCIPLQDFYPDNLPAYMSENPVRYFQEERVVEGVKKQVTRGVMLFPVAAKSVEYQTDAFGRRTKISKFDDTFQGTIAYDRGGFYFLSSFIDEEKVILKVEQGEGSAYLTIDRKSGANFLQEDNCSVGCRNLALLINSRFNGVLAYSTA